MKLELELVQKNHDEIWLVDLWGRWYAFDWRLLKFTSYSFHLFSIQSLRFLNGDKEVQLLC